VILTTTCNLARAQEDTASPVTLADVTAETLQEQAVLTATAEPVRRAAISPRIDGLVTRLRVDEGETVEAGQPILELDSRLAELEVEAARARVAESEARHNDAIRRRDELLELKKGRHASETDIQSAIANVDMTAAALSAERAALERAEELLERHRLSAPFSGVIAAKHVEVGEWAKRDEAAVELVAMDTLRIRATLPQRDYVRVGAGAGVTLRFDALPDRDFPGRVLTRVASGNPSTRSFPVLIDIPNRDGLLAPGMSARVRVDLEGDSAEALTVPRDAVVAKSDGSREVWLVRADDGDSKAYPVSVETGRAQGERVEILRGEIVAGDRVVLLGNERLRAGQSVAPQETATAALE
jgi:RND family efflux transporter MFP subunit